MIVAELALEEKERHDEASKEVKMPHQWSGQLFASREIKSFNHQNSNFRHLYLDQPKWEFPSIYIQKGKKGISKKVEFIAGFSKRTHPKRNNIGLLPVQQEKNKANCHSQIRTGKCSWPLEYSIERYSRRSDGGECSAVSDTPFLKCLIGLYGTLRERFSRDPITPQVIYDATLCKSITTRFRNWIASIYIQEAKERDAISDRPTARWHDTAFLECPTGLYGTLRDRSIHDAITQQPQFIYDATEWRIITPGDKNQTQKSRSIYDAMVWANISIGDGIAPHPILSMTERHRDRHFIYDGMS